MAFERLRRLGKDKFQKITNELMRGTAPVMVARLIQREWGDALKIREETLTRMIDRLHGAITFGAFGDDLAEQAKRNAVRLAGLDGSTVDCLEILNRLAMTQWDRVRTLHEKELTQDKPILQLNRVMRDLSKLVDRIQKMRFDLGFDEYKLTIPAVRAPATDHMKEQKRALEAYIRFRENLDKRVSASVDDSPVDD